jgi:hypothetical protein
MILVVFLSALVDQVAGDADNAENANHNQHDD